MLRLDRVTKRYGVGVFGGTTFTAVRDVSFEVAPGEVVSLIGESGSGKSTIGKMILKLIPVSEGTITLDGTDIREFSRGRRKEYYRNVQGVFQDPFSCYNPVFKADRVLRMIKEEYFPRVGRAEWDERVAAALERFGLAGLADRPAHLLSGGEKQLLAIASVTVLEPACIVFDEPTTALDLRNRRRTWAVVASLPQQAVVVTHDLEAITGFDRALLFDGGRIVFDGPPAAAVEEYLALLDEPL